MQFGWYDEHFGFTKIIFGKSGARDEEISVFRDERKGIPKQ